MRQLGEILEEFPEARLGLNPAEVERSRLKYGSNLLSPMPRTPVWQRFLEKFNEPIIKILLAAALLSILVELLHPPAQASSIFVATLFAILSITSAALLHLQGRGSWLPAIFFGCALFLWPIGLTLGHASFDGLAVMIAVILATGVAFLSEYQSDREFDALHRQKQPLRCKVRRQGLFQTIDMGNLVVGDLVVLEIGDELPADGRVVKATRFRVDQSLMTGEPEPVAKTPGNGSNQAGLEQQDCLYRGTQVVEGHGEMVVCAVGDSTMLGSIARHLADPDVAGSEAAESSPGDLNKSERVIRKLTMARDETPLQQKLSKLAALISRVGYVAAVAIFIAQVTQGIWRSDLRWPGAVEGLAADSLHDASLLLGYFMYMVIVIVVAVPEGLPMSVTISLALAMRKMTRANCLVRQLVACETVGSTTVICTDKTGTLTQNRMRVVRLHLADGELKRGQPDWPGQVASGTATAKGSILQNAAVNSTAHLEQKGQNLVGVGNSTETALLFWLEEHGIDYRDLRRRHLPLVQVPFSSDRKRMSTVIRGDQGEVSLFVKGSPEWILGHCDRVVDGSGQERPLSPELRDQIRAGLAEAAAESMRTLAFATARVPPQLALDPESLDRALEDLEKNLVFAGFVAIRDPLREDVPEAIASCHRAGIGVMMITGDNAGTARAIASEIGLIDAGSDGAILTSHELAHKNDDLLEAELGRVRVVARAQPLDKYRLVRLLQKRGEVVAVTGDGTNDAPALKRADVGLAMGISGTEVAKEASKIVLLDDAFSTIVKAVHWGRALYENIQRFLQFQLTINVSALVIAFLGVLMGFKPPFTILQLLWINVIMDTFAAVALCSEPPRAGLMSIPPKKRNENILTRGMLVTIGTTAAFFIVVMMGLLLVMKGTPENPGWLAGHGSWSLAFPDFTVRQGTIFFTGYVLFQVWNEINCRSLVPEVSGLYRLNRNPVFLAIAALIVVCQIAIVNFGGQVFQVEPLAWSDWLVLAGVTSSVLIFAEVVRLVRRSVRASRMREDVS